MINQLLAVFLAGPSGRYAYSGVLIIYAVVVLGLFWDMAR